MMSEVYFGQVNWGFLVSKTGEKKSMCLALGMVPCIILADE